MHPIQTTERTGTDSALSLHIPLGQPDSEFEVVVVVQPKLSAGAPRLPPGYFDLLGSIDDETFVVHPQWDGQNKGSGTFLFANAFVLAAEEGRETS